MFRQSKARFAPQLPTKVQKKCHRSNRNKKVFHAENHTKDFSCKAPYHLLFFFSHLSVNGQFSQPAHFSGLRKARTNR